MGSESEDLANLTELVARAPREQVLFWSIQPAEGGLLSAEVVGRSLVAMDELLCAVAKREGYKYNIGVVDIKTDEKFGVKCKLLITRLDLAE